MYLSLFVRDCVAKDEAAALSGMTMQVNVDVQLPFVVLVQYGKLSSIDCRMTYRVWLSIHSVKVQSLSVVSPVAALNAIWIEQWHNLEHVGVKERFGLRPILRKHVKHALEEK